MALPSWSIWPEGILAHKIVEFVYVGHSVVKVLGFIIQKRVVHMFDDDVNDFWWQIVDARHV